MPRTDSPGADWQPLTVVLDRLRTSRIKEFEDRELARELNGEMWGFDECVVNAVKMHRARSHAARFGEDLDREISRVLAKRAAINMVEAAAAALGIEEITEAPAHGKHAGGRPPEFPWHIIWALTSRDLYENGLPATIAELIRRIHAVCRENGIGEPSESTLRPLARDWFDVVWRGQRPAAASA